MDNTPEIALEQRTAAQDRLSSPSAGRNRQAIAQTLSGVLPRGAQVLEIASGTGEHGLAIVTERPDLSWQPSELDPASRASVDSWAKDAGGRIKPCLRLDMTDPRWFEPMGPFDAIFCANMIHIAPFEAAVGLLKGAGARLKPGGLLCLYGPFLEGDNTAPSNLDFDASLKHRDERWGVRSIEAVDQLGETSGLTRIQRINMPANNLMLVFERARA